MGGMLTWVTWVACLPGWRASVGDVGRMLAWVTWVTSVACFRGWRTSLCSVGEVGGVLTWVACYYYCYCYY